jgi:hypothetical protein
MTAWLISYLINFMYLLLRVIFFRNQNYPAIDPVELFAFNFLPIYHIIPFSATLPP